MRARWAVPGCIAVAIAIAAAGCYGTESTNPPGTTRPDGGGGTGPAECTSEDECLRSCDGYVEQIAARGVDMASRRSWRCDGSRCWCVVQSPDGCYLNLDPEPFDCALTDAQIVEAWQARQPPPAPPCSDVDMSVDAGTGTCIDDTPRSDCYHPRDPNEWQGMLVDICLRAQCDVSERCGLAAACLDDGMCGPCATDDQCGAGEVCVLDYCLLPENVSCRSYRECASGALCILSGITGGTPRGNEDMRAYCSSGSGATPMPME